MCLYAESSLECIELVAARFEIKIHDSKKVMAYLSISFTVLIRYYGVIALISADIVPSLDIDGRELASVRRYPNEGQYSPISVR